MKRIIIGILSIVILGTIPTRCSPPDPSEELLRKPVEEIREYLLELTPVGTSMDDVLAVVRGNDMRLVSVNDRFGFAMRNGRPSTPDSNDVALGNVVGVQSVRAILGSYWSTFFALYITHVDVFWAFDENSQLIDIQVRK